MDPSQLDKTPDISRANLDWEQMDMEEVENFASAMRLLRDNEGWKYLRGFFALTSQQISSYISSTPLQSADEVYRREFEKGKAAALMDAARSVESIIESAEQHLESERKKRGISDDD